LTTAALTVPCADQCGEGALWDWRSNTLYWLDLYRPTLHRLKAAQHRAFPVAEVDLLACLLLTDVPASPRLVTRDSIGDMRLDGAIARFAAGRRLIDRDARVAINDGKAHPAGPVWLGTADTREQDPLGRLMAFRRDAPPVAVDAGFVVSNGPAFAPNGRFAYFSDSAGRRILRYPVRDDGMPAGSAEVFAEFTPKDGNPDGLTVDADGNLWAAMWDGWSVRCLDPAGREIARVTVPAQRVTSVAFGDEDLSTLYITTATAGLDEAAVARGAGGLFAARPGAKGCREPIVDI
jgi:sugar lactone lactonase YvrE